MTSTKIKPIVVLGSIMLAVSALLIITQSSIKVDSTAISPKENKIIASAFGDENFKIKSLKWENSGENTLSLKGNPPDNGVNIGRIFVIEGGDNENIGFEVTTKGYAKDGVTLLVVGNLKTKNISAVKVLSLAETPGLGTKIGENNWLGQFIGASTEHYDKKDYDAVSGATRSSEGAARAVNAVIDILKEQ